MAGRPNTHVRPLELCRGADVSDEQLHTVLPTLPLDESATSHVRFADRLAGGATSILHTRGTVWGSHFVNLTARRYSPHCAILTTMVAAHPLAPPAERLDEARLRALDVPAVSEEEIRAAQSGWPKDEPNRTVWRILSYAKATGAEVSDDQLHTVLPTFSLDEIAASCLRVADRIAAPTEVTPSTTLRELLAEPSITADEALACGLFVCERAEWDQRCASST
jgi:hypothetical protein